MGFRINTNLDSIIGVNNLTRTNSRLSGNFGRLSSGLRINKAADDAAGLAVSENLRTQIRGLNQAIRNTNDGVSIIQTTEGALNQIQNNLSRLRELAVQSSSGTLGDNDRAYLNTESSALLNEIDRLANVTSFNGRVLLNGAASAGTGTVAIDVQVGIQNTTNDRLTITVSSARTQALGLNTVNLASSTAAQNSLQSIDTAIGRVSDIRSQLGATQNRLGSTLANLQTGIENLSSAESQIRDVDFASETAELSRNQILQQAGVSVLSQANSGSQAVLSLLR
ncbi:MAG: flagellin [Myxococcota bacterium]